MIFTSAVTMYTELNENEMKNLPIIANVVIKVVLSVNNLPSYN